jgi:BNR repeat-like domain
MRRLSLAVAGLAAAALAGPSAAAGAVDPLSLASGPSPFPPGCTTDPGAPGATLYENAEVEPWVDQNPAGPSNLIGVWQQDRWSNGGAHGLLTGVSRDDGRTWTRPTPPPFTRCAGGNAANGGDYARASDPWVSFSPNGDAHQIALALNDPARGPTAVTVSSSRDGGSSWGPIKTLIRDVDGTKFFNDKESITADPFRSRFVYATWDRLASPTDLNDPNAPFFGPTYFARSTDGGRTWSPARNIYDPGLNNQTIANQIVVLPSGRLVDVFTLFRNGVTSIATIYSNDRGRTWSKRAKVVDLLGSVGVTDPRDGAPVRTGEIVPDIAVDPRPGTNNLYLVWQDARFNGFERDQIAFSRSTNGGRSWSRPKRISSNNSTQAFTASVDVNGRGQLGVTYYDFTFDTVASIPLQTDYWATRSADGGRTFTARERITPHSFDMRSAPFAGGYFVGDYEGLASVNRPFKAMFVQANDGNTANPTDVFSTTIHGPIAGPRTRGSRGRTSTGLSVGRHGAGKPFNGKRRPYKFTR